MSNWEALGHDNPPDKLTSERGLEIYNCDEVWCRAPVGPRTMAEALLAIAHHRHHSYLGGCSHAR